MDFRDLYQQVIIDHSRSPRNFRALEDATGQAEGYNPLCGDKLTLYLRVEDDVVQEASFQGSGCAISTASASMLTEALQGKTRAEVETLFERFHAMLTGEASPDLDALGKLAAFQGVCEFPIRVKCATLAWHTMRAALEGKDEPITTE